MIPRELFQKIRRLEVHTRGLVDSLFSGEYHTAFKGQGITFAEVRPYQIGDDVRTIDWNVSARMGTLYVKLFEEEREQTLLLVVDVSGSQGFGVRGRTKRELAAEICAVLGFSALRNHDRVGLLLFSNRIEAFVPPRKGQRHVLRLVRDLYACQPQSPRTDLRVALDYLMRVLHRRAIILILSDFLDMPDFERLLQALSRRHDVVALQLQDPVERQWPAVGLVELVDAETGQRRWIDTRSARVRAHLAEHARQQQAELEACFRRLQIDHVCLRTDADYVEPLLTFFHRRNRRR
jgi:uncharacterized protein (DUF58 family)